MFVPLHCSTSHQTSVPNDTPLPPGGRVCHCQTPLTGTGRRYTTVHALLQTCHSTHRNPYTFRSGRYAVCGMQTMPFHTPQPIHPQTTRVETQRCPRTSRRQQGWRHTAVHALPADKDFSSNLCNGPHEDKVTDAGRRAPVLKSRLSSWSHTRRSCSACVTRTGANASAPSWRQQRPACAAASGSQCQAPAAPGAPSESGDGAPSHRLRPTPSVRTSAIWRAPRPFHDSILHSTRHSFGH